MKKNFVIGLMLGMLCACQQEANLKESENGKWQLGVTAAIDASKGARTGMDGVHTDFVASDEIGFFMPEEETPVRWIYQGVGNWTSEVSLYWPDKETSFSFAAFYPFAEGAVRSKIPMPDLSLQKGGLEEVGDYDFLLAETTCSYATSLEGKVPFTGESSFKHLYSLIRITLKDAYEAAEIQRIVLKRVAFSGTGMVKPHYYDLTGRQMKPVSEAAGGDELKWSIAAEEGNVTAQGLQLVLLVNPSADQRLIDFSISYERGGVEYQAKTSAIHTTFQSGKIYNYVMKIQKDGLAVAGSDISDWESGADLGDIVIDGEPVVAEKTF